EEIGRTVADAVQSAMFKKRYGDVYAGDERWRAMPSPTGERYAWDAKSEYVKAAPYFENMPAKPAPKPDIIGARVLVMLGDSVTTDHISPAGSIAKSSPAAKYLIEHGIEQRDFNSYGSRRGNHEVMMRGTFANTRLKNMLVPGVEGGVTRYLPKNEQMSIFDAAMRYKADNTPLVVLAGKEYGSGSSRDWAAKGPMLLGVGAVIAESLEKIHRSNLIGMGILPLEYAPGTTRESLGLTGEESFTIKGLSELKPLQALKVEAKSPDGKTTTFDAKVRIDTPDEMQYYRHGGILQYVLRQIAAS
ncbi:MAG: aconitate hydratase, partial [Vulcanimicrobiaceae bacterium]